MLSARRDQRVVLVTGGATGIGAATVSRFVRAGAKVVVNHFGTAKEAEELMNSIGQPDSCMAIHADVRDSHAVTAMFSDVERIWGPVTVLINNAGVLSRSTCELLEEAEWDRVVDTSLKGAFLCSRAALPGMFREGAGVIVNVSSDIALTGEPKLVHYAAAKAGLLGLTKALALEVVSQGIRVNAVAPGITDTPMLRANPETFNPIREASIPIARWAAPDEIAASIQFLASQDAKYYVGALLSPTGGLVTC